MSPAQLSRLRPQISALSSLFDKPEKYIDSLTKLLEKYRSDVDTSSDSISSYSMVSRLNVPDIVISQLEISYNHLVREYPQQTTEIANKIWDNEYFEYKQLALGLLSKLPISSLEKYFDFIQEKITEETETPIFSVILDIANSNLGIQKNESWLNILTSWVSSEDKRLKKIGLQAFLNLIRDQNQFPAPDQLKIIRPIFINPTLAINADLLELVEVLSDLSINEAAAFLISIGVQNPKPDVAKFMRKCAKFFPEPLFDRITNAAES